MAAEQLYNFLAETTLNGAINNSVTSLVITAVAASPTVPQFRIRIDNELMLVTAVAATVTYTVTRGIEGTTAASHATGARVYYVWTAAGMGGERTFTSATTPLVIGGTGTGSSLEFRSTSGVGATDLIKFTVGNNGATEAMRILNNGTLVIGTTTNPNSRKVYVWGNPDSYTMVESENPNNTGTSAFAAFKATAAVASLQFLAHGTGRTSTRYGITIADYGELLVQTGNGFLIGTGTTNTPIVFGTNSVERVRITGLGSVILNGSGGALATTATDGFPYIPTCAGTPTGVPTAVTGAVAMVFDTTGNKLWIYDGGWIGVVLA